MFETIKNADESKVSETLARWRVPVPSGRKPRPSIHFDHYLVES